MGSSFKMFKAILLACLVGYASCCTPSFFEMLTEIMTPTETTTTENPGTGGTGGTGGDCQCGRANRIQKIVGGQTTEIQEDLWLLLILMEFIPRLVLYLGDMDAL